MRRLKKLNRNCKKLWNSWKTHINLLYLEVNSQKVRIIAQQKWKSFVAIAIFVALFYTEWLTYSLDFEYFFL